MLWHKNLGPFDKLRINKSKAPGGANVYKTLRVYTRIMKINFTYNKEKDSWCLLRVGPASQNSNFPTEVYKQLTDDMGENPSPEVTATFIDKYIKDNKYDVSKYTAKYQENFDKISDEFRKRAEKVFGVSLVDDITAYLTINRRCPYNFDENWFFVAISGNSLVEPIAMHELWHFYTFYKFGPAWEDIGRKKYNDIKEALTVLLNVVCKDLFPKGTQDKGYPQHKELREKILEFWNKKQDINYVWNEMLAII